MDDKKKYDSQLKHLRSKYVRFSLDFRPDELEEFKQICQDIGTTPTTEIKKFVRTFCEENKMHN